VLKRGKIVIFLVLAATVLVANLFTPLRIERVSIELKPAVIARIGSFPVTNTLISSAIASCLLVVLAIRLRKHITDIPSTMSVQNFAEVVIEALQDFMEGYAGDKVVAFFPVVGTFFLFILTSNWLSLMPGFGSIGFWETVGDQRVFVPLLRGATSDLNTTVALAVCSVISSQLFGIRYLGFIPYMSRFVAVGKFVRFFKTLFTTGKVRLGLLASGVVDVFIGILDTFEEITKTISFSFRLFGNVFGGEVLLAVIAFLVPYVVSIPFLILELFTGALQAFIFAVLSTAFFATATAPAHGGEAGE